MKTTTFLVSALSGLAAAASSSHSSSTTHSSSTSHSASSSVSSSSASSTSSAAASTSTPGYLTNYSTITNSSLSFGSHYAVLNLDLINALVGIVEGTTEGEAWINSTATWIDAVNAQDPKPLSIFSRIYFSNVMKPELGPDTPFAVVGDTIPGDGTINDTYTDIYPSFKVNTTSDVVVQKARYYAGAGNQLEEVLRSQLIDTVILSGIRTSGVILNTAYTLFNLNYNVYVIADNVIETAPDNGINVAILEGILPKLPANVITLEQAIAALALSTPAVY